MKSYNKVFISMIIAVLVFFALLKRGSRADLSSLSRGIFKETDIFEIIQSSRSDDTGGHNIDYGYLYGKCSPYSFYGEDDIEELVENEVAEPLEGKELYLFYIAQIVEQYYPDVDPYIVMAVMETESNYKPDVQSRAGAVGLMQVIPKYHLKRAEKYGLNDIWDPYTNIICGVDLLNELYQKYGSWERGLLGYSNSQSYVRYVLNKAEILRGGNYFGETASQDPGGS